MIVWQSETFLISYVTIWEHPTKLETNLGVYSKLNSIGGFLWFLDFGRHCLNTYVLFDCLFLCRTESYWCGAEAKTGYKLKCCWWGSGLFSTFYNCLTLEYCKFAILFVIILGNYRIEWRANRLMGWNLNATLDGLLTFKSVLLHGGHGAALTKWHGGFIRQP